MKTRSALAMAALVQGAEAQILARNDLARLTIEELGNVQVTLVSRRPEPMEEAAASIFVITRDDIQRSTATSLPEALRLAPNLQVARLNAGQWAISARGFNNAIGNKLLVLVDGRTVYSPLFSGVFWEAQDAVLEDIDRIEVISGPRATLWGSNAVNGVIQVVTRSASDTLGALAVVRGGHGGRQVLVRYGDKLSERGAFRVYATRIDRDATALQTGEPRQDAMRKDQLGFRMDWSGPWRVATLQGDVYRGGGEGRSNLAPRLSGGNVLARWQQQHADGSNWQLQAYLDRARRHDDIVFRDTTSVADIEFSHVPATSDRHKIIWGLGHREARNRVDPTPLVLFDPAVRSLSWSNVFVRDEIQVTDALAVSAGAKVETNIYTGAEFLPSLRATYDLGTAHVLWGSVARAIRAPARLDRDFFFPGGPPFIIQGGPMFRSETANVVELGLRGRHRSRISYSLTAFHHDYSHLRAGREAPTFVENLAWGRVWGLEAWGSIDLAKGWRLSGGLVELRKAMRQSPQAGPNSIANLGNDPKHQSMLRLAADLTQRVQFDATVRHVSSLPEPAVRSYTVADVGLSWQATPTLELSLLVQNVGNRKYVEFSPAEAGQWGRAAYLSLEWRLPAL